MCIFSQKQQMTELTFTTIKTEKKTRAQDHETKIGDQSEIWSIWLAAKATGKSEASDCWNGNQLPFQPIRCLRFQTGLQIRSLQKCKPWSDLTIYSTEMTFISWAKRLDWDQLAHLCHLIRIYNICFRFIRLFLTKKWTV
jgi:hypothetical protein